MPMITCWLLSLTAEGICVRFFGDTFYYVKLGMAKEVAESKKRGLKAPFLVGESLGDFLAELRIGSGFLSPVISTTAFLSISVFI